MHLQAMLDGMAKRWQEMRAKTQMTLGQLIAELEKLPPDKKIQGIGSPHSYRGYYDDLAFEPKGKKTTAAKLLAECKGAMGKVFVGYKGGDFVMGELTPVWIAEYGSTGEKIIALNKNGTFKTANDE